MKKEKEIINILQVPSFKIKQAVSKYIEGAKRVCKAFNDASVSAREFEEALIKVNKMMNRKLKTNEKIRSLTTTKKITQVN